MAERGQYRSIHIALFDGKDFRALPSDARWVFTLLKMNLGYAGIGVRYPDELTYRLVGQSGMSLTRVQSALQQLDNPDWVRWEDNVIWLKRHLEFEPNLKPADPKHRKGLHSYLAGFPRADIVAEFIAAHPEWCPKSELKERGLAWALEGPCKGLGRATEAKSKEERERLKSKEKEKAGSGGDADNAVLISIIEAFKPLRDEYKEPDVQMLANLMQRFQATNGGAIGKVIGEIAGALDGIHGARRTWPELRTNIGDFLINPEARPSMAALRGYLYRNPDTSARNGAKPTAGQRAFEAAGHALRGAS